MAVAMASAVIVAAGSGLRMKSDRRKQYLEISGQSIVSRTVKRFDECPAVKTVTLVVPPTDMQYCSEFIIPGAGCTKPVNIVAGGSERHESVRLGLEAVPDKKGIVLIHDGVRPFVSDEIIISCIEGAMLYGACVPAIPVSDTVKRSADGIFEDETIDRSCLWLAQTPQAFEYDLIYNAHSEALKKGLFFTDDASVLELSGRRIKMVQGSRLNIKITTPEDMLLAESVFALMK
jgi:2-C-methyl-D-erythritol 4-phosphate cytidylyltransferase